MQSSPLRIISISFKSTKLHISQGTVNDEIMVKGPTATQLYHGSYLLALNFLELNPSNAQASRVWVGTSDGKTVHSESMSQAGRGSECANDTSSDGTTSRDCNLILLQRFVVNGSGGYYWWRGTWNHHNDDV